VVGDGWTGERRAHHRAPCLRASGRGAIARSALPRRGPRGPDRLGRRGPGADERFWVLPPERAAPRGVLSVFLCGLHCHVTATRRSHRTKNASQATVATSTAIEADKLTTSPYRSESAMPARMSTGENAASTEKTNVRPTRPSVLLARPGKTHDLAHFGSPALPRNSAPIAALNDTNPNRTTIRMSTRSSESISTYSCLASRSGTPATQVCAA
jgi:hypothetical protein